MPAPDRRAFVTYNLGEVRDQVILAAFRNSLRALKNPKTGQLFTEDEVARATQPGSRFYIEADAIDLYGQTQQARAAFLADQVDPRRATTDFLELVHSQLWLPEGRLPATGASGVVAARGTPGITFDGSTTVPDSGVAVCSDPNGRTYQVLVSGTTDANGDVQLSLKGIDAGKETNLAPGTVLAWSGGYPISAEPTAVVLPQPGSPEAGFTGGFDAENDQEFADRIAERIRARPASGNAAHFQAWAKAASSGTEQVFVYSCALAAGSVVVAPTQRRSGVGPLARLPSVGLLTDLVNFLVPPASAVVPERAYVAVVSPVSQPADVVVRLAMFRGAGGGWYDANPWPNPAPPANVSAIEKVQISYVASQTSFQITTPLPLPANATSLSGSSAPQIMVWDDALSRFEKLAVSSMAVASGVVTVTLLQAPQKTLAAGDRISPYTDRLAAVAESLEGYFDSLGPGEVVPDTDPRFARAVRRPRVSEAYPSRVGQAVVSVLVDGLGGSASDAELSFASDSEPDVPSAITSGPRMLTLGKVNVYPI